MSLDFAHPNVPGLDFRGVHLDVIADQTAEIEFEGARLSGKTWAICAKIAISCLTYPGIEWLISRFSNEETRTKLKPEFQRVCRLYGIDLEWNEDERCFLFPEVGGLRSKVYAYGLKSQSIAEAAAKVRGLGIASVWNDQTEELPQQIAEELRFATRQPGYPHQLIFSPNPVGEDHPLSDAFPEENPFPHRKYFRVSLYQNSHNLADGKIAELEALYPPTHAKFKSLILGMRGPNVVGVPVYDGVFTRAQHVVADVRYSHSSLFLEAIHAGQHHPVWLAAQLSVSGGLELLGGIMGKRMFLEDFLPIVNRYRLEWFDPDERAVRLCADPPPSADADAMRFTSLNVLRDAGLKPRSKANANAPDVREAVIQNLATMMRRHQGFRINADPTKWLMVSALVSKQSKAFVDALEGSYVWDANQVSVANKRVRQPKADEWLEGWMRCLENIALNFCLVKTPRSAVTTRGAQPPATGSWAAG